MKKRESAPVLFLAPLGAGAPKSARGRWALYIPPFRKNRLSTIEATINGIRRLDYNILEVKK